MAAWKQRARVHACVGPCVHAVQDKLCGCVGLIDSMRCAGLLWLASTVAVAATVYSIVGPATAVALLSCVIVFALVLVRATLCFCASTRSYCIVATGTFEKEVRPPTDGVFHVLLFQWHTFGTGRLYQCMLRWLNRGYDDWDDDFKDLGIDAAAWVQEYCERYAVRHDSHAFLLIVDISTPRCIPMADRPHLNTRSQSGVVAPSGMAFQILPGFGRSVRQSNERVQPLYFPWLCSVLFR